MTWHEATRQQSRQGDTHGKGKREQVIAFVGGKKKKALSNGLTNRVNFVALRAENEERLNFGDERDL